MATYFLRSSGGSDAADGLSFANGWATAQFMADTMVAGDIGLVCADGVHTPAATVDLDTNAGAITNPIKWRGASATGVDDGTVATISGSAFASGAIFKVGVANSSDNVWFEGIRMTAGDFFGFWADTNQRGLQFKRCRFDNCADDGLRMDEANLSAVFIDCEIDNNGDEGVGAASTGRGVLFFINCKIHNNTGAGIEIGHQVIMRNCWVYANGAKGLLFSGNQGVIDIQNSVFNGNTGDGINAIDASDLGRLVLVNNIISNNTGWGLAHDGGFFTGIVGSNLFYNNTSGHITNDGTTVITPANYDTISGSLEDQDPVFANTGSGTENFTIASNSPAFEAGYPQTLMESSVLGGVSNFPHIGSNVPQGSGGGGIIISG